jgi:hypothetical protein
MESFIDQNLIPTPVKMAVDKFKFQIWEPLRSKTPESWPNCHSFIWPRAPFGLEMSSECVFEGFDHLLLISSIYIARTSARITVRITVSFPKKKKITHVFSFRKLKNYPSIEKGVWCTKTLHALHSKIVN